MASTRWAEALRRIRAQIIVGALLVVCYLLNLAGVIPPPEIVYDRIEKIFSVHGVFFIGPISFIENVVGLNAYFPGSVAILGSMALTAGNPRLALVTFIAIVVPAFLAHQVNYFLGRRIARRSAVGKERGQKMNSRYGPGIGTHLIFFTTLWHPHFAALTSIDAGSQGLGYRRFTKLFGLWFLFWNIFWGGVMYGFGAVLPRESLGYPIVIVFLVIWGAWDFFKVGEWAREVVARRACPRSRQ
jgi:membrane protein DedA with SNARE-associated domain